MSRSRLAESTALAIILIAGVSLRLKLLFSDFWLDEIWSLDLAQSVKNPLDILLRLPHDNNHILNTLYLYLVSGTDSVPIYRLFAFVCGLGSIFVFYKLFASRGYFEKVVSVLLVSLLNIFVLYSTEARGYSGLIFFSLCGIYFLFEFLKSNALRHGVMFNLSCILALLSHVTAMHVFIGLCIYSVMVLRRERRQDAVGTLLKLHLVPAAALLFLYAVVYRHLVIGGGPIFSVLETAGNVFGELTGIACANRGIILCGAVLLLIVAAELYFEWKENNQVWIFYLVSILVSPLGVLLFFRPALVYPRYFLANMLVFILLFVELVSRLYRRGGVLKAIALFLLVGLVPGNLSHVGKLWVGGRGHYLQALKDMEAGTDGEEILVSSEYDFQGKMVMDFYAKQLKKKVVYVDRGMTAFQDYEWFLTYSFDDSPVPPQLGNEVIYKLYGTYLYGGFSGWNWHLYRRVE